MARARQLTGLGPECGVNIVRKSAPRSQEVRPMKTMSGFTILMNSFAGRIVCGRIGRRRSAKCAPVFRTARDMAGWMIRIARRARKLKPPFRGDGAIEE